MDEPEIEGVGLNNLEIVGVIFGIAAVVCILLVIIFIRYDFYSIPTQTFVLLTFGTSLLGIGFSISGLSSKHPGDDREYFGLIFSAACLVGICIIVLLNSPH